MRYLLWGCLVVVISNLQSNGQTPPRAAVKPFKITTHGVERTDNYYWMRDRENPDVIKYLKAENAYLESVMADSEQLRERLYQEIVARIKQDDSSVPYTDNGYEYSQKYAPGQQYAVYLRRKLGSGADWETILDVNAVAKGHKFCDIGSVDVSTDNRLAAYTVDNVGRRIYELQVKDLQTQELLKDRLPNMTGEFEWANDGQTLFYTRQDPKTLRSYQVFRHQIGTPPEDDTLVYQEDDETFWCGIGKSRSRKFIFIRSSQTLSTEYRYLDAKRPNAEPKIFQARQRDHEYDLDHIGDHFYIRSNLHAKNFRLLKVGEQDTGVDHWQEVIPHRPAVPLENFELFAQHLVIQERREGLTYLRIIPWSGEPEHELDFGEPAYLARPTPTPDANTTVLRFRYTSLTTPWSTYDYDMASRKKTLRKRQPVVGDFRPEDYVTERLWAPARDGKRIPISLVYRKGVTANSQNPCLLGGYGSYGFTIDPRFDSARLNLLDRGFVYAIAHIRGGEMLGREWYEDGKLLQKKNTFTDFIDCGEFLIKAGWADRQRIFAQGGSAGGLLMGAVINMRPDLFQGVIAEVPFVDVVTTMLDDSIPLTTFEYDEWGNPNEKKFFDYMLSYSPYDNVRPVAYPNLLVISGLHDSQVQYWEPTKWVAKLRSLKTDKNLLLLKTNMDAGHGGESGRFARYKVVALGHAFFLRLAGIKE